MPKRIFFDVGGTLLHPDWERLAAVIGRPEQAARLAAQEERARHEVDTRIAQRLPADGKTYLEVALQGVGAEELLPQVWEEHLRQNFWTRIDPEAQETLAQLARDGFGLGVISNSEGKVHELLVQCELAAHFDIIVDSGREGVAKPDPEIFWRACARARVSPAEALYVGDIFHIDVMGARNAGLAVAWYSQDAQRVLPKKVSRVERLGALCALAKGRE